MRVILGLLNCEIPIPIDTTCKGTLASTDQKGGNLKVSKRTKYDPQQKQKAMQMFAEGKSVAEVREQMPSFYPSHALYTWKQRSKNLKEELKQDSKKSIDSSEEFQELKKEIQRLKEMNDKLVGSLTIMKHLLDCTGIYTV